MVRWENLGAVHGMILHFVYSANGISNKPLSDTTAMSSTMMPAPRVNILVNNHLALDYPKWKLSLKMLPLYFTYLWPPYSHYTSSAYVLML